jgi:hypothetical protein
MPLSNKKYKLRVNARIASKVREKDLIDKAKALKDSPDLILPDCAEECVSCPFKKTEKRLERIQKYRDDPGKLDKFARRGDRLARAYAATISLAHEEKAPYLASAKYPGGTVMFAIRGRTDREKLIGVQNFDSPKWRVMAVLDLVKKRGLHFYSYGDNFVCTGRRAAPPDGYVKLAAESVGATKLEGKTYSCPHSPQSANHIEFDWESAGKKVLVCDQCAARSKNTLSKLAEGMAVPNVLTEFNISVVRPLRKVAGKTDCKGLLDKSLDKDLLDKYASGQIGDRELIDKHLSEVMSHVEEKDRKAFVRGDRCYGDDLESFVKDIASDDVEAAALKGLLSKITHPIVISDDDSVNRLLSKYWSSHGRYALEAVVSKDLAEKHYKDDDESAKSPVKVIRQALKEAAHDEASSKMPKYSGLSAPCQFADKVVRAYKTKGAGEAVAILDAEKSNDHRIRSIAYAFYLALGVQNKAWKYSREEKEFGAHLQSRAKQVLESDETQNHHEAFSALMREAGITDDIKAC